MARPTLEVTDTIGATCAKPVTAGAVFFAPLIVLESNFWVVQITVAGGIACICGTDSITRCTFIYIDALRILLFVPIIANAVALIFRRLRMLNTGLARTVGACATHWTLFARTLCRVWLLARWTLAADPTRPRPPSYARLACSQTCVRLLA
eukprot:SAG25_NODE_3210_length_1173_cov_1.251397_2_plen_151_part_00